MDFHYINYMTMPKHRNPCPGGHEITKFGRQLLGYHYYIHVTILSDLCLWVKKTIFKKNNAFSLWIIWTQPSTRTPVFGIMKFTISCPFTLQMLHTKGQDWHSSSSVNFYVKSTFTSTTFTTLSKTQSFKKECVKECTRVEFFIF